MTGLYQLKCLSMSEIIAGYFNGFIPGSIQTVNYSPMYSVTDQPPTPSKSKEKTTGCPSTFLAVAPCLQMNYFSEFPAVWNWKPDGDGPAYTMPKPRSAGWKISTGISQRFWNYSKMK